MKRNEKVTVRYVMACDGRPATHDRSADPHTTPLGDDEAVARERCAKHAREWPDAVVILQTCTTTVVEEVVGG